jgi:glycosyltransferase involved in cell wall biosynthesis
MKVIEVTNIDFALQQFILPVMLGIRARGHEVIGVCADGPLLAAVRQEGLRVVAVPMARSLSPLAQWRAFRALVRLFRDERPDLVHGHMPISGFLARIAARAAGVPKVAYTCHGFLFNQPGPLWRRALSLCLEWLGGRLTDVYMTVSEKEADDARRLGISPRAIAIRNGRDPARYRPDPATRRRIRAALQVPDNRIVVIAVSRLVRSKGYAELVAAMADVPNAELWVVGERLPSDHEEGLEEVFAASGSGMRLRRLGYRDDVPDLMAAADIFALPSYFEALPMSVIEAMLSGLPVVASDIPGPREQVVDGQTGLLVPARSIAPLAEALRRLARDCGMRARFGAAGRARASTLYDETKVVARTLDLMGL